MKKLLFALGLLSMSVTSCVQEMVNPQEEQDVRVYPEFFVEEVEPYDTGVKTSLTEDRRLVWSAGDQLAIFQGSSIADKYQVKDSADGQMNASFSIVREQAGEDDDSFAGVEVEFDTNVALYPYQSGLTCVPVYGAPVDEGEDGVVGYKITDVVFPAVQSYVPNSFAEESYMMVSVTSGKSDHTLKFKNVCGVLKLQLKGTAKVRTIELMGNADEPLSGSAIITAYSDGTVPTVQMLSTASKTVTLDCGEGVQLNEETPTVFMIALPPTAFATGFTATLTAADGSTGQLSTTKANPVNRSKIKAMPALDVKTTPAYTPTDYCLTATYQTTEEDEGIWLYSSDHEIAGESNPCVFIDYGDGTFGESNEHTYENVGDYTVKFYFENPITEISSWVFSSGITHFMKSVTIPKTVRKICECAFMGMSVNFDSHLEEVIFEEASMLETIENRAFAFNSSLKEISLPASVKELGDAVFYCCKRLENIRIASNPYFVHALGMMLIGYEGNNRIVFSTVSCFPSSEGGNLDISYGYTTIKMGCFSFCDLTRINWMVITSVESNCFGYCDNLEYVNLDQAVTIGSGVLNYCKSLKSIDLPMASSIGSNVLCNNESLETIGLGCGDLLEINTLGNNCASLKEIRIPSGVTSITSSFNNDPSIESVYVSAQTPPALTDSFNSIPQNAVIYVPYESLYVYKSASGWSSHSGMMVPYDFENGEIFNGSCPVPYIDEYGINHGPGIEIGETVWAPVNCGYHAEDYKYGKLYQWGRKYGQGHNSAKITFVQGPVDESYGSDQSKANEFYYISGYSTYGWANNLSNMSRWNKGTETYPSKSDHDPCPDGWRVPTLTELSSLTSHWSPSVTVNNQEGKYFSGSTVYSESVPRVFFPAAGRRKADSHTSVENVGFVLNYATSKKPDYNTYNLHITTTYSSGIRISNDNIQNATSVRCVQE